MGLVGMRGACTASLAVLPPPTTHAPAAAAASTWPPLHLLLSGILPPPQSRAPDARSPPLLLLLVLLLLQLDCAGTTVGSRGRLVPPSRLNPCSRPLCRLGAGSPQHH